jgi:hypothetical protein
MSSTGLSTATPIGLAYFASLLGKRGRIEQGVLDYYNCNRVAYLTIPPYFLLRKAVDSQDWPNLLLVQVMF